VNRRASGALAPLVCLCWLALATGFGAQAAESSDPIDLGGQPLPDGSEGSSDGTEPIELDPGLWQATLPQYSQYFTYQRRIEGSRVHIGVLGAPQDSDGIGIKTSVGEGDDETSCGDQDDSSEFGYPHAVIGAEALVGDEDPDSDCRDAETIRIAVDRGSSSSGSGDLPYVIKVVEEAPASGEPGEPDDDPGYDVPEPATAQDVSGSTSFDEAPLLDASGGATTVKATVTEGTEVLWRVPVSWGEQPVMRVDIPAAEGADAEALPEYGGGPEVSLHLIDPMRAHYRYVDSSGEDSGTGTYQRRQDGEEGGATLVASGYPVTRANGLTPGDHWISLSVKPPSDADRDPLDVPVELTVELQGEPDDGPSYNKAVLSQGNDTGPKGYSPAKPFLIADGTFSAVASGNPRVADEDGDDSWLTGRHVTGLALAAVSVLCLGAGVVRLRARR